MPRGQSLLIYMQLLVGFNFILDLEFEEVPPWEKDGGSYTKKMFEILREKFAAITYMLTSLDEKQISRDFIRFVSLFSFF